MKKEEADATVDSSTSGLVDGLKRYWNTKNIKSLDGLTGLDFAPYTSETFAVKNITYKADNESARNRNRNGLSILSRLGGVNLLVGFSVGVLVASVFSRYCG